MEMRYFWLLDGEAQKYFSFHHHPGQENLGDLQTKAFTAKDTERIRPFYQHMNNSPRTLVRAMLPSTRRGCVGNIRDPYVHRKPLPNVPILQNRVQAAVAVNTQ